MTTIQTKRSTTTTSVPADSTLALGELAVNITDKKVWIGGLTAAPVLLVDYALFASGGVTYFEGSGINISTEDVISLDLSSASFSSANLANALTDETGSGSLVFATSPTLVTPLLGTPTSGILTNCTGTASGLTAGTVTTNANLTGHITSTGNATALNSFTSLELKTALTDETGSGFAVFATSPTLVTPLLGTPTSGILTNCTGTASGLTAGTATNANNIAMSPDNTGTSFFVTFVTATSGNNVLRGDSGTGINGLTYVPSTATLTTGTVNAATITTATDLSITTASATSGNDITIRPYGIVSLSPTSSSVTGGTNTSISINNSDMGAGLVTVAGGDLYLSTKYDDFDFTQVNIIFEGATANGFETTLTVADPSADRTITLPNATGTVALTTDLSQFAATSSAQLATLISDETGSGALVFATSPTLVTPALGAATATSLTAGNTGVKVGEHASKFLNITSDGSNNSITQSGNSTLSINHSAFGSIYIGDSDGANNSTYIDVNDNNSTITLSGAVAASVVTADAYRLSSGGIHAKTASYTLVAGDNGKIITMNVATANNLTVPASLDVGFNCTVIQLGAGQTTIVASGTTLNSYQGNLKISGQHGSASIVSYVSNVYNVAGSLSA